MVPPVRWYYLLSSWIFILSCLYPIVKIPTYPLNLLASVGCFEVILNPHKEHWLKNLYILFIHVAPFFWIPYDLSQQALLIAATVIVAYLGLIWFLRENPFHVYSVLLDEDHKKFAEFTRDRFGFNI
jgi:hypothetical protein